jgi:uncharacterized protein (DUF1330 family)
MGRSRRVRDARGPGGPEPPEEGRVVVVEFPSMERLRRWYAAVGYAEALKISEAALSRRRLLVEGVED